MHWLEFEHIKYLPPCLEARSGVVIKCFQSLGVVCPEGDEARQSLVRWCFDEGVPPPQERREGHRQKVVDEQPLAFEMVVRPIGAGSLEWKS